MIEVKSFAGPAGNYRSHGSYPVSTIDGMINEFLSRNNVKVIDIKLSAVASGENAAAVAMVLYEREEHEGES